MIQAVWCQNGALGNAKVVRNVGVTRPKDNILMPDRVHSVLVDIQVQGCIVIVIYFFPILLIVVGQEDGAGRDAAVLLESKVVLVVALEHTCPTVPWLCSLSCLLIHSYNKLFLKMEGKQASSKFDDLFILSLSLCFCSLYIYEFADLHLLTFSTFF